VCRVRDVYVRVACVIARARGSCLRSRISSSGMANNGSDSAAAALPPLIPPVLPTWPKEWPRLNLRGITDPVKIAERKRIDTERKAELAARKKRYHEVLWPTYAEEVVRRDKLARALQNAAPPLQPAQPAPPPLQLQPPTAAGIAAQPQTDAIAAEHAAAVAAVAAEHAAAVAAGWLWDAEWQQYYDPVDAEQQNEAEAREMEYNQQLLDDSERSEVRSWLYEQIEELEMELAPPVYSEYELTRLRTIVGNNQILLKLAEDQLVRARANGRSLALLSVFEEDCRKAQSVLDESVRVLQNALE